MAELRAGFLRLGSFVTATLLATAMTVPVAAQVTSQVSLNTAGEPASTDSGVPSVSADGRWVAFSSSASNLVPNDTNNVEDVFVRDLDSAETVRVSIKTNGTQANGWSRRPSISGDGRFIVFESAASSLINFDPNGQIDVFVHDRDLDGNGVFGVVDEEVDTVQTFRVSNGFNGQPNGDSFRPVISSDGFTIVYESESTNQVPGVLSAALDVYIYERDVDGNGVIDTPAVRSVTSVSTAGGHGQFHETIAAVSGDGRFVAFQSPSPDLVVNDDNGTYVDVFLRDRDPDDNGILDEGNTITSLVTRGPGGAGNRGGSNPSLSGDGRWIAYESLSTDLGPADGAATPGTWQIWVQDRLSGENRLISRTSEGAPGSAHSRNPAISDDGRYVVFDGHAGELAPGGVGWREVFVHDRDSDGNGLFDEHGGWTLERASVSTGGQAADGASREGDVSANGGDIVFLSQAANLSGLEEGPEGSENVLVNGRPQPFEQIPLPTGWFPLDPDEGGVAGWSGVPQLDGEGTLVVADAVCLILREARPFEQAFLFASPTRIDVPLLGGVLVPAPDITCNFTVPANKTISVDATWPEEFGPGTELYFQYWVSDPYAPQGFSASNALFCRTP